MTTTAAAPTTPRLLKAHQVWEQLGVSRSTFLRMVDSGEFPKPLRPRPKLTRWTQDQINAYVASKTPVQA